jgi:hypothetical protein
MKSIWYLLLVSVLVLTTQLGATAPEANPATPRLDRNQLLVYQDRQGVAQPATSVRDWEKRRAEIVRGMELVMGPLPGRAKRCVLDLKIEAEGDRRAYIWRFISYASEPGSRVPAWLLVLKQALTG